MQRGGKRGRYSAYNRGQSRNLKRFKARQAAKRNYFPKQARNRRTGGYLGIEKKFYDTSLVAKSIVTNSGMTGAELNPSTTINFTTMTQGDGEQQRDGRRAVVKSVYITGQVKCVKQTNQTATDNSGVVFLALVRDKQTNAAELDSESVYTNPSADGEVSTCALRNLQFSSRFQVLAVKRITIRQPTIVWDGTNVEQGGTITPFKLSWSGNMPVLYKGTTETVANIVDNSIQLVGFASNQDQAPVISYNARTRFVG